MEGDDLISDAWAHIFKILFYIQGVTQKNAWISPRFFLPRRRYHVKDFVQNGFFFMEKLSMRGDIMV